MTEYEKLIKAYELSVINLIQEYLNEGISINKACVMSGIPKKTYLRYRDKGLVNENRQDKAT